MKRSFSLMISCLLMLMLCLSGCSNKAPKETSVNSTAAASETAATEGQTAGAAIETSPETVDGINEDIPQASEVFTMDDYTEPACGMITVNGPLYKSDNITITADSFETDSTDTYLMLTIENTTDKDLSINCISSAVNGFMIDSGFSDDVAAGSKTETAVVFENTYINACGIRTIASAELVFSILDLVDYTQIEETGLLTVTTDADPESAQTDVINGELLYSLNNFQIINKGIIEDDEGMSMIALLLINKTDKDIFVSMKDDTIMVDGSSYPTLFTEDLPRGKNTIAMLPMYDPENGPLTFQESAILSFSLQDMNSWEIIDVTDPVTILRETL